MEILKKLKSLAEKKHIDFLVIGGHAVNAYGYSRQTGDIDLLTSKDSKQFWKTTLEELGYSQRQDHPVFAQYQSPRIEMWPIDFMFVDQGVLEQMLVDAQDSDFGGYKILIPGLSHLISLKLHTLKQRQLHREEKDINDIVELLRRNPLEDEELRQLCERYDRIDLYDRLQKENKEP